MWWGRVLLRWLGMGGLGTPTAAVPAHQASHPLPPHLTLSLFSSYLSFTSGTSAMWCWAPHARRQQVAWAVLYGPRTTFSPLTPLGPMAMARDVLCQGQGRTLAWAGGEMCLAWG